MNYKNAKSIQNVPEKKNILLNWGNERKICLTSKNSLFYAPIFNFQINDQKTLEFRQPSDIPRGHFFGLNWVKQSHLKFAINIFIVRIQKSITRRSRSHQF